MTIEPENRTMDGAANGRRRDHRPRHGTASDCVEIRGLDLEWRGIDELMPYVHNARTHSKKQVRQIAASIEEFSFTNPILIDADDGTTVGSRPPNCWG